MGFENYLTTLKMHIRKHVRDTFVFTDTAGMTEEEIKGQVMRLLGGALPIPTETIEWIGHYVRYISERDELLVYDNATGIWFYEHDDKKLVNLLCDYFTEIVSQAKANKDRVYERYANSFFKVGAINNIANRIKGSTTFLVRAATNVVQMTENFRYFKTVDGRRALLDLSQPTFNLHTVTFAETQDMMLMHLHPVEIAVNDAAPTLWLSLIETYMMGDPVMIEYFHKVLAYLMSPYNYNQVMPFFLGDGRNGKGTVVKVLQDILGPHATRMNSELLNSNPSSAFKKDDALAATEGKSLLIFNEIDERMVVSTQNIKDITEGGRDEFGNRIMTVVRPAYSRNYDVNICGTPLVIANTLLNFGDWSALDPIFKRLILVPFDYKIIDEDPTILNKLAKEYPQIQAWLYMNYFKYKGINLKTTPRPQNVERRFIQFRADSDIINMFWTDCLEMTGNSKDEVLRSDLYRMYDVYCRANGRKPIRNKGTNGFANLIEPYIKQNSTLVLKNGSYYVQGVKKTIYYTNETAQVGLGK